jgi:hypothetical protein
MPSDPVKAVLWFLHWFLKVLVRFFWLPILIMVIYITYANWSLGGAWNGIISGVITLFVGIGLWALLYGILLLVNIASSISRTITEVTRLQQDLTSQRSSYFFNEPEQEGQVVEGTITDLEQERRKRRRE